MEERPGEVFRVKGASVHGGCRVGRATGRYLVELSVNGGRVSGGLSRYYTQHLVEEMEGGRGRKETMGGGEEIPGQFLSRLCGKCGAVQVAGVTSRVCTRGKGRKDKGKNRSKTGREYRHVLVRQCLVCGGKDELSLPRHRYARPKPCSASAPIVPSPLPTPLPVKEGLGEEDKKTGKKKKKKLKKDKHSLKGALLSSQGKKGPPGGGGGGMNLSDFLSSL
eukprot:Nk52_evm19s1671 gene=Nk52_evmTU19s1671